MIPLLMMIPAREKSPNIAVKSKKAPVAARPKLAPMMMSGIVSRMIAGRRNESNCRTSSRRIPKSACGAYAKSFSFDSAAPLSSP